MLANGYMTGLQLKDDRHSPISAMVNGVLVMADILPDGQWHMYVPRSQTETVLTCWIRENPGFVDEIYLPDSWGLV